MSTHSREVSLFDKKSCLQIAMNKIIFLSKLAFGGIQIYVDRINVYTDWCRMVKKYLKLCPSRFWTSLLPFWARNGLPLTTLKNNYLRTLDNKKKSNCRRETLNSESLHKKYFLLIPPSAPVFFCLLINFTFLQKRQSCDIQILSS